VFDIYRPKPANDPHGATRPNPEKSVALRLTLNSEELSLSEDQIESSVQAVVTCLVNTLGARQRA
jgi:phenylalanyl-tRNA synthetase beta chain